MGAMEIDAEGPSARDGINTARRPGLSMFDSEAREYIERSLFCPCSVPVPSLLCPCSAWEDIAQARLDNTCSDVPNHSLVTRSTTMTYTALSL